MILPDAEIRRRGAVGELFDPSTFADACVEGCAYEFRASDIAYRYDYERRASSQTRVARHIIQPFETVTIITEEEVRLDERHFLMVFSKGALFSLGLVPVCTAADPGFRGRLGITLINLSGRPVTIARGTRFVKGVFHRLETPVERPYHGQHGGAATTWPYPSQFHGDHPPEAVVLDQIRRQLPPQLRRAVSAARSFRRHRQVLWIVAIVTIALDILAISTGSLAEPGWSTRIMALVGLVGTVASVASLLLVINTED